MQRCDSVYMMRVPVPSMTDVQVMAALGTNISSPFVVNFGSGCYSNTLNECLKLDMGLRKIHTDQWPGLLVEARAQSAFMLRRELRNVAVVSEPVTPLNVVDLLRQHRVPFDAAMLKIDIDGYDCAVLDALLDSGWRPRIVFMEVHLEFPPPVSFAVGYHEKHTIAGAKGGFFGCSLSAASAVMRPRGYDLLQFDMLHTSHDAVWAHESVSHRFSRRWHDWDAFVNGWAEAAARYKLCACSHPPSFARSKCCPGPAMKCHSFRPTVNRNRHSLSGLGTKVTCHHMLNAAHSLATTAHAHAGHLGGAAMEPVHKLLATLHTDMPKRARFHGDSPDAPFNLSINLHPNWVCLNEDAVGTPV